MLLVILFGPDLLPEASKHVPHTALLWSCLQAGEAKPVKGQARQARAEARKTGFGRGARQAFDPARCQRLSRHGPRGGASQLAPSSVRNRRPSLLSLPNRTLAPVIDPTTPSLSLARSSHYSRSLQLASLFSLSPSRSATLEIAQP
jgi:hypothetical protein